MAEFRVDPDGRIVAVETTSRRTFLLADDGAAPAIWGPAEVPTPLILEGDPTGPLPNFGAVHELGCGATRRRPFGLSALGLALALLAGTDIGPWAALAAVGCCLVGYWLGRTA